jgi:hypothetical protein
MDGTLGSQTARMLDGSGVAITSREDLAELQGIHPSFDHSTPLWYYLLKEAELMQEALQLGRTAGDHALGHVEDPQQRMSDAEVITTGLVAMLFLRSNFEAARTLLSTSRYMPRMLSRSRLNRRLHRLKDLFLTLFELFGHTWKQLNTDSVYIIDSFPIAVCDNYRIPRVKLYRDKEYRGCLASKKRYFYGLKVHLLVTKDGQPVECFLTPGSYSDVRAM